MKFYEMDGALPGAVNAAEKPVRVKIEVGLPWGTEGIFEQDILEADFFGLKEAAGGVSARGEILINNEKLTMKNERIPPGAQVRVSFSIGDGLPWFERFVFYIDDKGIQDIRGPGRRRLVRLSLRDLSAKLRKTDEGRDWASPAVFAYSAVCDKTRPEGSLVHGIAKRAGLGAADIDCATIPVTLPFVRLRKNIWAELSDLARAYRCHLECAPEKPLVFAHSPYQSEPLPGEECSYTFTGEDIFYLRKISKAGLYRNAVRLKINLPVSLERQEVWRYNEPPVLYDQFLQAHYPFKYPLEREIEKGGYDAHYTIIDSGGKERAVVYADEIDTKEEAEGRLDYDVTMNNEELKMNNGIICYSLYDVTSHYDRAILTLHKEQDIDLYNASIFGRPIVLDLNRSCFRHDREGAAVYGTAVLNVTGSYFSEYLIDGKPQYEDWVIRELAERVQNRHQYTVKTHRGLFNARVGAGVQILTKNEQVTGKISGFHLRYRRDEAFQSIFHIIMNN